MNTMTRGLNGHYWDCECEDHYIHPRAVETCTRCGRNRDEMPDSHSDEVAAGTHFADDYYRMTPKDVRAEVIRRGYTPAVAANVYIIPGEDSYQVYSDGHWSRPIRLCDLHWNFDPKRTTIYSPVSIAKDLNCRLLRGIDTHATGYAYIKGAPLKVPDYTLPK